MLKTEKLVYDTNLHKAREIISKNKNKYRDEIISLINKIKIEGIRFGRCFPNDNVIWNLLHNITNDNSIHIKLRIQALYEILTEYQTDTNLKEYWLNYLINNITTFRKVCIELYPESKDEYYNSLLKKLENTPDNKRWVYLIELIALYDDQKSDIKHIITNHLEKSNDKFIKLAGNKCLEYLKTK